MYVSLFYLSKKRNCFFFFFIVLFFGKASFFFYMIHHLCIGPAISLPLSVAAAAAVIASPTTQTGSQNPVPGPG